MPEVSNISIVPFQEGRVRATISAVLDSMGRRDMVNQGMTVPMINPSLDGDFLRLKHYLNRIDLPDSFHNAYFARLAINLGEHDRPERLTLFSAETRNQFLQGFAEDRTALATRHGVDLGEWSDDREVAATFQPLTQHDLAPVMDRVRRVDPSFADEIIALARGKLPLD